MYHNFQSLPVIISDNLKSRPFHLLFLRRTELPRDKETKHMSSNQSMSLADRNFMSSTKLNKKTLTYLWRMVKVMSLCMPLRFREMKVELTGIYKISFICKYKVIQQRERFFRIRWGIVFSVPWQLVTIKTKTGSQHAFALKFYYKKMRSSVSE